MKFSGQIGLLEKKYMITLRVTWTDHIQILDTDSGSLDEEPSEAVYVTVEHTSSVKGDSHS